MRYLFASAALLLLVCGCKPSGGGGSRGASGGVHDGETSKGALGSLRSALSIYYGDMGGQYPQDMAALTVGGKYLNTIPTIGPVSNHPAGSGIRNGATPTDEGGWLYNNLTTSANVGNVTINCTHTDVKGTVWTAY